MGWLRRVGSIRLDLCRTRQYHSGGVPLEYFSLGHSNKCFGDAFTERLKVMPHHIRNHSPWFNTNSSLHKGNHDNCYLEKIVH